MATTTSKGFYSNLSLWERNDLLLISQSEARAVQKLQPWQLSCSDQAFRLVSGILYLVDPAAVKLPVTRGALFGIR